MNDTVIQRYLRPSSSRQPRSQRPSVKMILHIERTTLYALRAKELRSQGQDICFAAIRDVSELLLFPLGCKFTRVPSPSAKYRTFSPIMQVEDLSPISHMVAQLPSSTAGTMHLHLQTKRGNRSQQPSLKSRNSNITQFVGVIFFFVVYTSTGS